jgi:predicted house-cleaning noncanonical NTP pyrophosphatase (MazG superfamily)
LTPTSRSLSESDRSQKKLTIDDLDGKLYEETDEEMVQEVVEGLADLTELLLLSENVPGFSEPQLVWRKRSNLQNVN